MRAIGVEERRTVATHGCNYRHQRVRVRTEQIKNCELGPYPFRPPSPRDVGNQSSASMSGPPCSRLYRSRNSSSRPGGVCFRNVRYSRKCSFHGHVFLFSHRFDSREIYSLHKGSFIPQCVARRMTPFVCLQQVSNRTPSMSLSHKADISRGSMFCIPSFDEMTNLTPYFNHVIPAHAGIQTVSHSASQVEEISETGSHATVLVDR